MFYYDLEQPKSREEILKLTQENAEVVQNVIQEFTQTVEKHVGEMESLKILRLKLKNDQIFGNLDVMLEKETIFLSMLKSVTNLDDLCSVILNNLELFEEYRNFLRNHVETSDILEKYCNDINKTDIHRISSPFRQLGFFKLFLERIIKSMKKIQHQDLGKVENTRDLINDYLAKLNDDNAIYSIKCLPNKVEEFGKLILRENFTINFEQILIIEQKVFLFERALVIAHPGKSLSNDIYIYKSHYKLDNLYLATNVVTDTISIGDYEEYKKDPTKIIEMKNGKREILEEWNEVLQKLIFEQLMEAKAKAEVFQRFGK